MVGFYDIAVARWRAPPLTTIRQPFAEMGATGQHRTAGRDVHRPITFPELDETIASTLALGRQQNS